MQRIQKEPQWIMERGGGICVSRSKVYWQHVPSRLARGWYNQSKVRREVTRHPVDRRDLIAAAGSVAAVASASQAFAQMAAAFLDHAVPGVGLTVSGSPRELRLYFNLGVVVASSSVQVITSTGAAFPVSRPVNDPSDQQIVIVRLGRALPPGTYTVSWHTVSVRGRPASGTYRFTVS
jgi:copper resistance protein C